MWTWPVEGCSVYTKTDRAAGWRASHIRNSSAVIAMHNTLVCLENDRCVPSEIGADCSGMFCFEFVDWRTTCLSMHKILHNNLFVFQFNHIAILLFLFYGRTNKTTYKYDLYRTKQDLGITRCITLSLQIAATIEVEYSEKSKKILILDRNGNKR